MMERLFAHLGRPATRDLLLAFALVCGSGIAISLEPSSREFWAFIPLLFAVPLFCSGLLLALPWEVTKYLGVAIHAFLLLISACALFVSVLALLSVLFAGTALVLAPPAMLIAVNSGYTIVQTMFPERLKKSR